MTMECRRPVRTDCGRIELIFGPMFSGKTTELIRRCKRYQLANYRCTVVKYARDRRYTDGAAVATHDRLTLEAVPAERLAHVWEHARQYDVVAVDEAQFFADAVEFSERLAALGKTVLIAALDGDYLRRPFANGILSLVARCEQVVKLQAVCMLCHSDAAFTLRLCDDTKVEVIGGADKYMAACRRCHDAHAVGPRPSSAAVDSTPLHNISNPAGSPPAPGSPRKSPGHWKAAHAHDGGEHARHRLFDAGDKENAGV